MKKRLLIAGGSGLIGTAVKQAAEAIGWEVIILSRTAGTGRMVWDPSVAEISLQGSPHYDAIINLAGTSIAGKRWSRRRKVEIRTSRTRASQTLEKYLSDGRLQTSSYIGISGIGIYGHRGDENLHDHSSVGMEGDWLIDTTRTWEESHRRIASLGIRTVILRTGIVLSRQGGALKELLMTAPFGFLARFGSGRQYWSWIHIDDIVQLILTAVQRTDMHGIYLTCAPGPVRLKIFAKSMGRHMRPRRWVIPVPVFALRVLLGEMHRVLMDSCNGYPERLVKEGFTFRFPDIDTAMHDLFRH